MGRAVWLRLREFDGMGWGVWEAWMNDIEVLMVWNERV